MSGMTPDRKEVAGKSYINLVFKFESLVSERVMKGAQISLFIILFLVPD